MGQIKIALQFRINVKKLFGKMMGEGETVEQASY